MIRQARRDGVALREAIAHWREQQIQALRVFGVSVKLDAGLAYAKAPRSCVVRDCAAACVE